MCDDSTLSDDATNLSRRSFAALAGATVLWPGLVEAASALPLVEREVLVKTPDGQADAFFVHPAKGKHPAVLVWPDIWGLRPAFRQMARRLAGEGYAVLVVNPFYRQVRAPVISDDKKGTPEGFAIVRPYAATLTRAVIERDAAAFVAFLDAQTPVNRGRKMATTGYCMGGPITMVTAATHPSRIGAAASFHGGGLATAKPDSPHLLVPKMKAQFLAAIAENDDQKSPQEKDLLRTAFASAGLAAEIEVYAGAMHGWCPPDSRVYNHDQAERAWARMLALFARALV